MASRRVILETGYFPKELPPPFTTKEFANYAVKPGKTKRKLLNEKVNSRSKKPKMTAYCPYWLSSTNALHRTLAITNPVAQYVLVDLIVKNWPAVLKRTARGSLAASRPVYDDKTDRPIRGNVFPTKLEGKRVQVTAGFKFQLTTDISRFYPSIYTHAIPWAYHGKEAAKKAFHQGRRLFADQLDTAVRNTQSGQTKGIPIGPDTSFLLAEIIGASVDRQLTQHGVNKSNYTRWYDDFTFGVLGLEDGHRILGILKAILGDFELELNESKTECQPVGSTPQSTWLTTFNGLKERLRTNVQSNELQELQSTVQSIMGENPGCRAAEYAVQLLYRPTINEHAWVDAESLLYTFMVSYRNTIPKAAGVLSYYHLIGRNIDRLRLKRTLTTIISEHAPLGHSHEVAWSLWCSILFRIVLDRHTIQLCRGMSDNVVQLLCLDLRQRKLDRRVAVPTSVRDLINCDELSTSNWLLAYEAAHKGWLPDSKLNPVLSHRIFRDMHAQNVFFYDDKKTFWDTVTHPMCAPRFLIEDLYRSVYRDQKLPVRRGRLRTALNWDQLLEGTRY